MTTGFLRYDLPPGGAFWCRPELVDATRDDIVANDTGALEPERRKAICIALEIQIRTLVRREPAGVC